MTVFPEGRPRRVADFRLEELDGELLLYHPGLTSTVYLNPTAALIWRLADGCRTVGEIGTLLSAAYPDAALEPDLEQALLQLAQHGAIEWQ